ncbi:MAG TPA: hypothetical protein PLS10_10850, partial [Chitinophagales bacterium]|nr:hypothetical protein [Chitinophagales bacterium]
MGIISYLYQRKETNNKPVFLFDRKHETLATIGIAIALIHIVVVFALVNTKSLTFTEINSLSFLVRIGLGIYVSNVASNLGRNQVFWGFMGFFDSFVSLVILSSSPKLFSYEKEINDGIEIINEEFINKQNVISELKINSLIDDKEYDRKLAEIKDNYFEEINNFPTAVVRVRTNQMYYSSSLISKSSKNLVVKFPL